MTIPGGSYLVETAASAAVSVRDRGAMEAGPSTADLLTDGLTTDGLKSLPVYLLPDEMAWRRSAFPLPGLRGLRLDVMDARSGWRRDARGLQR